MDEPFPAGLHLLPDLLPETLEPFLQQVVPRLDDEAYQRWVSGHVGWVHEPVWLLAPMHMSQHVFGTRNDGLGDHCNERAWC